MFTCKRRHKLKNESEKLKQFLNKLAQVLTAVKNVNLKNIPVAVIQTIGLFE